MPFSQFIRTHKALLFAILFGIAPMHDAFGQDRFSNRPAPDTSNLWYSYDANKDTVVVFVHGVLSDSRDAWFYEGKKDTTADDNYWPDIVANDTFLDRPTVFLGGFHTNVQAGDYDIRQSAIELFESLAVPVGSIDQSVLDKKKIVFIAHSTGGLVVKHMLVRERDTFKEKRIGLVLVASPSLGAKKANRLSLITKFAKHKMGQQLQFNHPFLEELHKDFQNLVGNRQIPALDGLEMLENYFVVSWLSSLVSQVVPRESVEPYFRETEMVGGTDHFSIAKPNAPGHQSHKKLRRFIKLRLSRLMAPGCSLPDRFQIRLAVNEGSAGLIPKISDVAPPQPGINIVRRVSEFETKQKLESRQRSSALSANRAYYEIGILGDNPCPGDEYRSWFVRAPGQPTPTSRNLANAKTKLCFVRSRNSPPANFAGLECDEGAECVPFTDRRSSGIADICPDGAFLDRFDLPEFSLFGRAHAATAGNLRDGQVWVVPTRDTLIAKPEDKRPGFTEFYLSGQTGHSIRKARYYTFGVKVNNQDVYLGGVASHSLRHPYFPKLDFGVDFVLQNLNFTGGKSGHETIGLDFRFYNADSELLTNGTAAFEYVSYRHLQEKRFPFVSKSGDKLGNFTIKARYRPGSILDTHEIFLASSKNPKELVLHRKRLASLELSHNAFPLVTVIRPPLPPNPYYGLSLALLHPNKQVEASYSFKKAVVLCKWLWAERNGLIEKRGKRAAQKLIRDDIYAYKFHRFDPDGSDAQSRSGPGRGTWEPCAKIIRKS